MSKLRQRLKELRKKPATDKQELSFLILLLVVPLIIFFWLTGLKTTMERVVLGKEQEFFGQKLIRFFSQLLRQINQGMTILFSRLTELVSQVQLSEFFKNLSQLILGKPRVEFLEPGQPVELPISS